LHSDPYLDAVRRTLPRLLALFDGDRTSASHGLGDRYHWAWGLIDFGNGTFQGAAHGLARLWAAGLWPHDTPREHFVARIDSMFAGARALTRGDGSLEEAFPYEGSYCVTALVAHDLLCALELLRGKGLDAATAGRWQDTVAPMIAFLLAADETHAFITNHLATAAAALARWHARTGSAATEARARALTQRILSHQSEEGWFDEYGGADPGYQSLATVYLADLHRLRPDWALGDALARSVRFLWHFAHPDGSFGGLYGSRCTRLWHPAGIEALAAECPEAQALAQWLARSVQGHLVVGLDSIDEPNLVPMFNSYCQAAELRASRAPLPPVGATLPALRRRAERVHFPRAGLLVDAGERHYSIVATHKGGVVMHFLDGRLVQLDAGVVVRDARGRLGSTQAQAPDHAVRLQGDELEVQAQVTRMPKRLPSPAGFLMLRLGALSLLRWRRLREALKRALVRWLIAGRDAWPVHNRRRIRLGPDLSVHDDTRLAPGYERVAAGAFVAIHMASQGYWQLQDELPPPPVPGTQADRP
jgi:hypothetical protein